MGPRIGGLALDGYEIGPAIGSGGFADVYGGRRLADSREVAIKIARAPDPRFAREAAALRALGGAGCPALVELTAIDDRPVIVMDRVDGPSLAETSGPLALELAIARIDAVCAAVAPIHDAGYVHRDLKPSNLVLQPDGSVVVLDFGLATPSGVVDDAAPAASDPRITQTGERVGTALYMAPEQIRGEAAFDPRTDVYAIAVVLFELVAGRAPFVGARAVVEQAHASRRPPPLSRFVPEAAGLDAVIAAALAKSPAERPANARELQAAIASARQTAVAAPAPAPEARPRESTTSTRPVAVVFVRTAEVAPVTRALRAERGVLLASIEGGHVGAFPEAASVRDGLAACISAAGRLPRARCVAHVLELRVREGARGVRLPMQRFDQSWTEGEGVEPLELTAEAAEALGAGVTVALDSGRFAIRRDAASISNERGEIRPSLVGRAALLETLTASAARARDAGLPTLATVVAEPGLGKTRLASELAAALRPSWEVIELAASDPRATTPGALLRAVISAAFELEDADQSASLDAVRAACDRALGDASEALWPAVASTLERLPADDPRVTQLQAAPGAYRQALARAIAAALVGRAGRAPEAPLAVIVDDVHFADQTTLDALELATLGERAVPLWIGAFGGPRLLEARGEWGDRAGASVRVDLAPLEPADTRELLLELLDQIEYIPRPIVDRLVDKTGGVPSRAIELVRAMHALGAIRRQPGTRAWFIAADDVLAIPVAGLAETTARRAIERLSPQLRRLAEVCVILDDPFTLEQVSALLASGAVDVELDPSVGLPRLARERLLRADGEALSFRTAALREVLERELDGDHRQLHAQVLAQLDASPSRSPADLLRIARHALALGERARAGDAYLELARYSSARNQDAEAEQLYTRALALLDGDAAGHRAALIGRGIARYRLWRMNDALDDLRAARSLAEAAGDHGVEVELLLEEATILDWMWQFADERPLVLAARERAGSSPSPRLEGRLLTAEGRLAYRDEQLAEAAALFERAIEVAEGAGDDETVRLVLLMLAPTLAFNGEHDRAAERFVDAIEACERAGDRLHLGAVYSNRLILWIQLDDYPRAVDDGRRAIELAREVGNAQLERAAQHNVAELLIFMDRAGEAREPALRARDLERRFYENPQAESAILVARALASLDLAAAGEAAREVRELGVSLGQMPELLLRSVELLAEDAGREAWDELLAEVRDNPYGDEKIEIMLRAVDAHRAAGDEARAGQLLAEAASIVKPTSPLLKRVRRLQAELGAAKGV